MKPIHSADRSELLSACSTAMASEHDDIPNAAAADNLKQRTVDLYSEYAGMDQVACGCSAEDAERHHRRIKQRVRSKLMKEHGEQACGFGVLGIVMLLSYLVTIFKAIWDWRNGR